MAAPHAVRETAAAIRRTPLLTLVSVLAVSVSLFVVGLFALTAYNIRRAIEAIEERVEVVAYLRDGTSDEQLRRAQTEVSGLPGVLALRYVSKTEALTTAVEELREFREVFTDLDTNPLPASLEIRLRPGHRDPATIERIARRLGAYPFVEEVGYGRDWVGKIVSLRRIAAGGTAIIGGSFAAVAGIIIASAIRISVFARREEIAIMRLVGATDGFIRRPFLLEGLVAGLLGGVCAAGLTYAAHQVVSLSLMRIEWIPLAWVLAGVAAGALFGLVSSSLAVRRHLKAV